jgi:hypothetical protein
MGSAISIRVSGGAYEYPVLQCVFVIQWSQNLDQRNRIFALAFSRLACSNYPWKRTQTSHRLAGLAVILLFIEDANNGFPKKPIELAFLMRARSLEKRKTQGCGLGSESSSQYRS